MPHYISPPPMNPVSRLLAAVLGVLVLAGAFFFGLIVLALVAGLGLIAWLAFSLRVWWLQRKFGGAASGSGQADRRGRASEPGDSNGDIIDAEYTVVSRRDED
ncbi:MAG: hypothetical protein HKN57_09695 [Xanthomonadales bacterium]|nr:hypothetical protein [Gammaproteobacteria bacterium]MBT8054291.1 hypothetical protein [Gammaproteobacteria bacterium]NND57516.1 hypothetical protein [Xanthomonadales bacterium]NNK51240.1 hypothetical protein [Xanthomonadales bacterium]